MTKTLKKRYAFTMAEILLSLTIIGVVAAITLPSLMANINERTWNTQRKALYARMSQAIAMMPQVGGYGKLSEDADGNITEDTAAETFLTEGLSKVLKINNICDSEHLADCGIPASYTNMVGSSKSWPKSVSGWNYQFVNFSVDGTAWGEPDAKYSYSQTNTKAAAFETQNGESIVVYYNPKCVIDDENIMYPQSTMCANFIYDLNGNRGPNVFGKDIGFITALYPTETNVVAPMPLPKLANGGATANFYGAIAACQAQDVESRQPNRDELTALFFNRKVLDLPGNNYWSGSAFSSDEFWFVGFGTGRRSKINRFFKASVQCIKR